LSTLAGTDETVQYTCVVLRRPCLEDSKRVEINLQLHCYVTQSLLHKGFRYISCRRQDLCNKLLHRNQRREVNRCTGDHKRFDLSHTLANEGQAQRDTAVWLVGGGKLNTLDVELHRMKELTGNAALCSAYHLPAQQRE
jgi:hypothetical protein